MFEIPLIYQNRHILHIDADAFFATVEQVLNPALKGKPILVGWSDENQKGIVSTASYEAKALGIKSGMPMYKAMQLCPGATIVKGNYKAYGEFSRQMYSIFQRFASKVEMPSIDEAFLDITDCLKNEITPQEYAKQILFKIFEELKISISCGLASNKTVAKVASSTFKPHKLTVVPHGKEKSFLAPMSLKAMPGIGEKTYQVLSRFGLKTLGDLSSLSADEVSQKLGKDFLYLWKKSMGVSSSSVKSNHDLPKSISKERTFYYSSTFNAEHLETLAELSEKIIHKLQKYEMQAKSIALKIRYKNQTNPEKIFRDCTFNFDLGHLTSNRDYIKTSIQNLFQQKITRQDPVRLIGVGLGNLIHNYNLSLFP